jgi:hypothetical protein
MVNLTILEDSNVRHLYTLMASILNAWFPKQSYNVWESASAGTNEAPPATTPVTLGS